MYAASPLPSLRGTGWNRSQGTGWTRRTVAALLAAVLAAAVLASVGTSAASGPHDRILVQPATSAAADAVRAVGGTVGDAVRLVDGFLAEIPRGSADRLDDFPAVGNVTLDRAVEPADSGAGDGSGTSLDLVRSAVGVDRKGGGSGVTVAQIDTGVANVPALSDVRRGYDATGGNGRDGLGHGTHLAGIIAGDGHGFDGVASGARLISVDAAEDDGSTTLLDILQAMDWVGSHRIDQGIRVVNLSLAVDPLADVRKDPMAFGVEALNAAGIVVVVAGGNRGATTGQVTSPGYAPSAITVGAVDVHGTASVADDTLAAFSPAGSDQRRVDVVAPGTSIASLRAPGSIIDTAYPAARVGSELFKGSGTSQATAVVSGLVANLLARRPYLTPAQVKNVLVGGATPIPGVPATSQGAGMVNLDGALSAPAGSASGSGFFGGLPGISSVFAPWAGNGWGGNGWGGNGWGGNGWGAAGWGSPAS
jgi:serine protease AprX